VSTASSTRSSVDAWTKERLSVADVMGKVLAKITENERAEEPRVELGLHRRWNGADFLEHFKYHIAGGHALGIETIGVRPRQYPRIRTPRQQFSAPFSSFWSPSHLPCPSVPAATSPGLYVGGVEEIHTHELRPGRDRSRNTS